MTQAKDEGKALRLNEDCKTSVPGAGAFTLLYIYVYLRIEDLAAISFLYGYLDNWCQVKQAWAFRLDKCETQKMILKCNQIQSNTLAV